MTTWVVTGAHAWRARDARLRAASIGDNGSGGLYGYRMSKAALNMAGMSLARDLARIDMLTPARSGKFPHANGEELPW
jgi:hypothetical protein